MRHIWFADETPSVDDAEPLRWHITHTVLDADGDTVRICSCGWESLPSVYPGDVERDCAVQIAQQEGYQARISRLSRGRRRQATG